MLEKSGKNVYRISVLLFILTMFYFKSKKELMMCFQNLKPIIFAHILFPVCSSIVGIIFAGLFLLPNKPIYVGKAIVAIPMVDNKPLFSSTDIQQNYPAKLPINSPLSNSNEYLKNSNSNFRFKMADINTLIVMNENYDEISTKFTLERYITILMSDLDKAYESEAIKNERQIMAIRKELQNANNDLAKYQIIFFTNPNLDQFFLIKLLDNIASLASRLKIKLVSVSKSSTIIMAPMTTKEPFYPKKSSYLFFGWIVGVFVGIVLNNLYRRLRNIS